jgi:acyl-CoA synthetase (AMP-forming)/AMP-acid ligase II/3-hydroxymyristoyl/3-hydroxydecanoyl-(acyl carrier protein) dehydratase
MSKSLDMLSTLVAARSSCHRVGWRNKQSVAYGEFLVRVRGWRALLRRTAGQAFALHIDDSIEFASALFGAWQAGKTIFLPGDKLPATCADLRQRVDGYLGEFESVWQPMVPMAQDLAVHEDDLNRLDPEFAGVVLYTSGSTSVAQAIPKKLFQLSREVATLESQFGKLVGAADIVATVSHQHIYGLLFKVLWPFTAGRAIHARSFAFIGELTASSPERDRILVSTPAHLKRLPKNMITQAHRPRTVFSSGGPLPFEVAQESERLLGVVPIEVYGSSETGGIAWRQQLARTDAAWKPMPGVTWRVDPKEGVLEIRSPNLPNEDWFRTADRATAMGSNHFLLNGRVDRIVKVEEKRISLSAIEAMLTASPMVTQARAVVIDGRRQRIAVFIVPSGEGSDELVRVGKFTFNRMLRELLRRSIDPVGLPRLWRYLDALPVDAQGKTTQSALIALLDAKPRFITHPCQHLLERTAQRAVLELTAPRDLVYFDGHFSDMPILAGVVQVDWVISYGRRYFSLPPVFRGIHGLKFQRVIAPEMPFTLELIHETEKSSLSFKITSHAGLHASGRIIFGAGHV